MQLKVLLVSLCLALEVTARPASSASTSKHLATPKTHSNPKPTNPPPHSHHSNTPQHTSKTIPPEHTSKSNTQQHTSKTSRKPATTTKDDKDDPEPTNRKDYAAICKGNALDAKMWKEFEIEQWIGDKANDMPSGKMSFLDWMAKHTPGVSQFTCESETACALISTEDGCDTSPPKENPKNWAVIYAIMYFHNFVNMLIRSVEAAQTSLNTLNGYLTAHFTSSNFKLAAETWKNTVASASTTATGAILSLAWVAFPELGILSVGASAASLGGASATFKTGIELSFLTKTVGVIENQLQETANMDKWLSDTFKAMKNGYKAWGETAVNGIVHQTSGSGMYTQNKEGIVQWIKDGAFAKPIPEKHTLKIEAATVKAITGAAVSNLWRQEKVYLVNTTDAWIYAGKSYDKLKIDKDDITRVEVNGDIFFFMKHTDDASPEDEYDSVPGIGKLGELGIDIKDVVRAAVWSQNHVGFNSSWLPEQALHAATSDDPPPAGLFMNIPVCHLGQMPHPSLDLFTRGCKTVDIAEECDFKKYVDWSCKKAQMKSQGETQQWPIHMYPV